MGKFIEALQKQDPLYVSGKVEENAINEAKKKLNTVFSEEYEEYLKEYGCASFAGHELTGICKSKRLNVVDVTLECRSKEIPEEWYVIEEANIDGVLYWQDNKGIVYESIPGHEPIKYADSLYDYCFNS